MKPRGGAASGPPVRPSFCRPFVAPLLSGCRSRGREHAGLLAVRARSLRRWCPGRRCASALGCFRVQLPARREGTCTPLFAMEIWRCGTAPLASRWPACSCLAGGVWWHTPSLLRAASAAAPALTPPVRRAARTRTECLRTRWLSSTAKARLAGRRHGCTNNSESHCFRCLAARRASAPPEHSPRSAGSTRCSARAPRRRFSCAAAELQAAQCAQSATPD